MENLKLIPWDSVSVLSLDVTCDCGMGKTLRDRACIIPMACPGVALVQITPREHQSAQ